MGKQRAKTLLLIDSGSTQQKAAEETGLTIGQVRYCFRRYKTMGIKIFPENTRVASVEQTTKEVVAIEPTPEVEVLEEVIEKEPKVKKTKKKEKKKKKKKKKKKPQKKKKKKKKS